MVRVRIERDIIGLQRETLKSAENMLRSGPSFPMFLCVRMCYFLGRMNLPFCEKIIQRDFILRMKFLLMH